MCELAYSGIVGNTTSIRHDTKYLSGIPNYAGTSDGYPRSSLSSTLTDNTTDQVQLIFRHLPSDFDDLGFMDSVTELYVTQGAVSSHNFLHLTFQEFFLLQYTSLACHQHSKWSTLRDTIKEGRLKVVLGFVAGLNKLTQ